jgi:phage-related tail fiber protein
MRTKVLLCAAALAASLASSMAQNVYSLNVVGYYNVTIPANGFYMVANQLNTTNNTLAALVPNATEGTGFFKYNGGYSGDTFSFGAWGDGTQTLNPGEAAFFRDAGGGSGQVFTFVGEVLQNTSPGLVNTLPIGNSIRASMVPQAGTMIALAVPGEEGDGVFVYTGGYSGDTFSFGAWGQNGGNGPNVAVGQGFFYKKAVGGVSTSWVRSFTVQ